MPTIKNYLTPSQSLANLKMLDNIAKGIKDSKVIAYSKEATHAMKRKGPSDKRLKEILVTNCQSKAATDQEQRWMAGHILEMNGYKLEE